MNLHRSSQKRIYFKDAVYFITVKTHKKFSYFKERIFCDLFIENLRLCKRLKQFELYGWVLAYDHCHLLIRPNDEFDISEIMRSIKTNFSCTSNRIISPEGAVTSPRLQEIYQNKFDISDYQNRFQQKYPKNHSFPKFQWQKSFHDHYIRNTTDFRIHMEYVIDNLYHHPLPKNWPYIFTNYQYDDLNDEC